MKRLTILSIAILSASLTFAERTGFRDRTENWLQHETTSVSGGLRNEGDAPTIGGQTPTDLPTTPSNSPIGDAIGLILALGLVYGGSLFVKKHYEQS
ncbi:hypothetical protein FACS189413_11640 [Bacteroidia bacterium]|nr:hypothetical protein FACS189413_11640 [Bacteroidia bacterium]